MANKSRVKTKFIGGGQAGGMLATTSTPLFALIEAWTVQDDIRIIGCELIVEINALDAHYNADFHSQLIVELTRAAAIEKDGILLSLQIELGWTAAINSGGGQRKSLVMMFPEGHGVDMDDGEIINLIGYASLTAAGGDCWHFGSAIIYYIER